MGKHFKKQKAVKPVKDDEDEWETDDEVDEYARRYPQMVDHRIDWKNKNRAHKKVHLFTLLDLPVECVLNVVCHVRHLRQRFFLFMTTPRMRPLFAHPKSCHELVHFAMDDGEMGAEVKMEYCGIQSCIPGFVMSRKEVVIALNMSNLCTRKLKAIFYVGSVTRSLIAMLLDWMKTHKQGFVGSWVYVKLELNEQQRMSVPAGTVRQLLDEFRARECSVALTLLVYPVPRLKLSKKADQLNDIRQYLGDYPFCSVVVQQMDNTKPSPAFVDVPGCFNPTIASAALANSLQSLDISGKPISSVVLSQILRTFTQLQTVTCLVSYEAEPAGVALDFHPNIRSLRMLLEKRRGEATTPAECEYYRALVNGCPNAVRVAFGVGRGKFAPAFTHTMMVTCCSTRAFTRMGMVLMLEEPVFHTVRKKVERSAQQMFRAKQDHRTAELLASGAADLFLQCVPGGQPKMLELLPTPVATAIDYLGAELNSLCVKECMAMNSLIIDARLAGMPCQLLFV